LCAALCVALAAMAVGAAAKPHGKGGKDAKPTGARLDLSFGKAGVAQTATPAPAEGTQEPGVSMALGPKGRVYALQGKTLLAFEADGKPAKRFGKNGRVTIGSSRGEILAAGVAVDSEGRVLVAGTLLLAGKEQPVSTFDPQVSPSEAFIIRFLPNGNRDITFGNGGETDTTFGLPHPLYKSLEPPTTIEYATPIVAATTFAVDAGDRPVVGGSFITGLWQCGYSNEYRSAFVGRLTASGAVDTTYAGKGYAVEENVTGSIRGMATTPEGGVVTLSNDRPCGPKEFVGPDTFNALTESGTPSPALNPARPTSYGESLIAVDPQGRSLILQTPSEFSEEPVLVRLLPSGDIDTSFGFGGGIPLQKPVSWATAMTVDGKGRTILAGGEGQLVRYTEAGKRDWMFGHKGVVPKANAGDEGTNMTALAVGNGRIYAASSVEDPGLKTGYGVQIARYLPGK
jgi:hypothetical protein